MLTTTAGREPGGGSRTCACKSPLVLALEKRAQAYQPLRQVQVAGQQPIALPTIPKPPGPADLTMYHMVLNILKTAGPLITQ